ncbi:hypothetical protein [uncultured Sphingomonas sp.]|uniref:hypothetical protein n=1 Tax=uncultured Sphingomonas sp. TaxID=158754 RepID=UPI0025D84443|nr:hypothetical protein [uncultured Sphingomonas sp.]
MTAALYINESAVLLKTARAVLVECERNFPAWVAAGQMTQAQADKDLRRLAAIVADWRRIAALRVGQPAEPLDTSVGTFAKYALLRHLHEREQQQLAADRQAVRQALDPAIVNAIIAGDLDRPTIQRNWKERRAGFTSPTLGVLFDRERRAWTIEALLWHADRWPRAMDMAETQAALIARDRPAEPARAAA